MDGTEYTYEDAAKVCGVSYETIRQRLRRGKLRKGRPTNTNRPTVVMTADDIATISAGRLTDRHPDGQPTGQSRSEPSNSLAVELAALRERLAHRDGEVVAFRDVLRQAAQAVEEASQWRALTTGQMEQLQARADQAEAAAAAAREQLAEAQGELEGVKLATEHLHDVAARADQAEAAAAATREQLAQARGELEGVKLSTEHLHEVAAQARREAHAAEDRAAAARQQAEDADRKAVEAQREQAQLRERGWLARLRNRP